MLPIKEEIFLPKPGFCWSTKWTKRLLSSGIRGKYLYLHQNVEL